MNTKTIDLTHSDLLLTLGNSSGNLNINFLGRKLILNFILNPMQVKEFSRNMINAAGYLNISNIDTAVNGTLETTFKDI
ncbi:hypothetical protein [Pectinatus haikarae]|uniref:Uncharacterized protein n=1 Tax=Pectinatus haikarae TaxID=349096 RepID=A0ABT9Y4W3_9FIRM|nr:hypothetical protein [Pectinatus haikarae]MDQ0202862.1 hypothetical protein [Pectinatus haikarae]